MKMIKCFDTINGRYVDVEVTEEIEVYIKRSYWREDMQDRRFQARKLVFDEALNYTTLSDPVYEEILKAVEITSLREGIEQLDQRSKEIIFYRYYEEYTINKIATTLGISSSYVTKLLRKVHTQLRQFYNKELN